MIIDRTSPPDISRHALGKYVDSAEVYRNTLSLLPDNAFQYLAEDSLNILNANFHSL